MSVDESTSAQEFNYIEAIPLAHNLLFFYWGRHPQHASIDMRLGGGSFVVYEGKEAVMIDCMNLAGHGQYVRDFMTREHGIERFTLVNTHWHEDHIAENHVYSDCTIIAHTMTRRLMAENRSSLELGSPGVPPFPVVLPTVCFSGRLDIWCGSTLIELHEFAIHEHGHICACLSGQKTLLAADMLEDPVWFFSFDVATPEAQIAEYKRMAAMDIEHLYTVHGDVDTQRHGGYSKDFIHANAAYLQRMINAAVDGSLDKKSAEEMISKELAAHTLHWWEAYREVHELNKKTVRGYLKK